MPTNFTPSLRQLTALQTIVRSYMGLQGLSDTELDDVITAGLNMGIGRINSRRWNKIINSATITLVADQANYTISGATANDFRDPLALFRLNSDSERDRRIEFKDIKTFFTEHSIATQSGTPEWYTVRHETRDVFLNVPPTTAFVTSFPTLSLFYYRRVGELSSGTDTLDIPPEFDWFILWSSMSWLAEHQGDTRRADRARQESEVQWRSLVRDDTEIQTDWSVFNY